LHDHDELLAASRSRALAADYINRLAPAGPAHNCKLEDLFPRWRAAPRRGPGTPLYIRQVSSIVGAFVSHVRSQQPAIQYAHEITKDLAATYLATIHLSPRSYNNHLIVLRSVFTTLMRCGLLDMLSNPFSGLPTRSANTQHRAPFTPKEVRRILRASKSDPIMHAYVVTGLCTAMRRGDVCCLRWGNVDLSRDLLAIETSKTKESAQIPIFPPLRAVLEAQPRPPNPDPAAYVFPALAAMYEANPTGLTWRMKRLLEKAKVANSRADRADGVRSASVRDYHSFRTTWITLALAAGVPVEIVRRVTGHQTTEVVLTHYFRPGLDQFKTSLQAMPKALLGSAPKSRDEQIAATLRRMTEKTWESDRDKALEILNGKERPLKPLN
jgi:integrase